MRLKNSFKFTSEKKQTNENLKNKHFIAAQCYDIAIDLKKIISLLLSNENTKVQLLDCGSISNRFPTDYLSRLKTYVVIKRIPAVQR